MPSSAHVSLVRPDGSRVTVRVMASSTPTGIRALSILDRDGQVIRNVQLIIDEIVNRQPCPEHMDFLVADLPVEFLPVSVQVTPCVGSKPAPEVPETFGPFLSRDDVATPGSMPCVEPVLGGQPPPPPTPQCLAAQAEVNTARNALASACFEIRRLRAQLAADERNAFATWALFLALVVAAAVVANFPYGWIASAILILAAIVTLVVVITLSQGVLRLRRRVAEAEHRLGLATRLFTETAERVRRLCCPRDISADLTMPGACS